MSRLREIFTKSSQNHPPFFKLFGRDLLIFCLVTRDPRSLTTEVCTGAVWKGGDRLEQSSFAREQLTTTRTKKSVLNSVQNPPHSMQLKEVV
jgi:hypothetical protein